MEPEKHFLTDAECKKIDAEATLPVFDGSMMALREGIEIGMGLAKDEFLRIIDAKLAEAEKHWNSSKGDAKLKWYGATVAFKTLLEELK